MEAICHVAYELSSHGRDAEPGLPVVATQATRLIYLTAREISASVSVSHFVRCPSVNALIVVKSTPAALTAILSPASILFHVRQAHQWGSMLACLHVRVSGISASRLMPRCGENEND